MLNPWTQGTGLISKKEDSKAYPDVIFAVGKGIDELSKETLKSMQETADGVLARRVEFLAWRKTQWSFGVEDGTADIGLFADGAISRLGRKRLLPAMKNLRTALKDKGRILFLANEDDERVLGGVMDMGVGNKAVDKFGFKLLASKRQHGVVVGQLRKKGVQLLEDKAEQATEAKGFVDRGSSSSSSRPKALKGVRPVPRRR